MSISCQPDAIVFVSNDMSHSFTYIEQGVPPPITVHYSFAESVFQPRAEVECLSY